VVHILSPKLQMAAMGRSYWLLYHYALARVGRVSLGSLLGFELYICVAGDETARKCSVNMIILASSVTINFQPAPPQNVEALSRSILPLRRTASIRHASKSGNTHPSASGIETPSSRLK